MKQLLNAAVAFLFLLTISNYSFGQNKPTKVSSGQVQQIIADWSAKPREVANTII
jgi:hypothetical protein